MNENVTDVVMVESARQTVILVFGVVGVIAMGLATYYVTEPSAWSALKMRMALKGKEYALNQVEFWEDLAARCSTLYQRERE